MRPTLHLLLPLLPLTVADDVTLLVSNFGLHLSNTPLIPSHIAFIVTDPRPDHFAAANCMFSTNETYPSIYLDGWWHCESGDDMGDVAFWLEEDFVKLRRPWRDGDTWLIGITEKQDPAWTEAADGECGNFSASVAGSYFSRTMAWEFPVTTIIA